MTDPAPLLVYMIHWNAPEWAGSSARSILGSQGINAEVIVIDNLSKRSGELGNHLPCGMHIIRSNSNVGYAGAANLALRDWWLRPDAPEFCVICAHDLHVRPDTFQKMLAQLRGNPSYAVLGPRFIRPGEEEGSASGPPREVRWVSGACLMLRRSAVEGILFDEEFGSYVEDVDYCLRVADAGHRIGCATQAVAWELGSVSASAGMQVQANTVRLRAKRHGWLGLIAGVVLLAGWALRFGVAACIPWRPKQRRGASHRSCTDCLGALGAVGRPGFWRQQSRSLEPPVIEQPIVVTNQRSL